MLLFPQLLRVPQRGRLPLSLEAPLAQLVFFEPQRALALGQFGSYIVQIDCVLGCARHRQRPGLATNLGVFELPAQLDFTLGKFVLLLAEPDAARSQVRFELRDPGVQLGLAAIDFPQTFAQMLRKLVGL